MSTQQDFTVMSFEPGEDVPVDEREKQQSKPSKNSKNRARNSDEKQGSTKPARRPKEKQSNTLVNLITSQIELVVTPDNIAFGAVPVKGHKEIFPLDSPEFGHWIYLQFFRATGTTPSKAAVAETVALLQSSALFGEGSKRDRVFIRVAGDDERIWIDLGDPDRRIVEITKTGWEIVEKCQVPFRRPSGMGALPVPERGGSISGLKNFFNCDPREFKLLVAWIIGTFRPSGPYPILEIDGEQGSAKSSLTKLLKMLIDPTDSLLNSPPKDGKDVALIANSERVLAYDNLSSLSAELQDVLCRLATGGAFRTRSLYSNALLITFVLLNPVIINSIGGVVSRPDLLDRAIKICLRAIDKTARLEEKDYWAKFRKAQPKLLGALFDCLSATLRALPSTSLQEKPRLADFAIWITAAESYLQHDPDLDWKQGDFLAAFMDAQQSAASAVLDGDEFAQSLIAFAKTEKYWSGSASDLLRRLQSTVPSDTRKSQGWPASNRLRDRLQRLAPLLRDEGVIAEQSARTSKLRAWTIKVSEERQNND